jgi:hypothetical protein
MKMRLFVVAIAGAALLHAPLLSAQIAAEPQTYTSTTAWILGVLVGAALLAMGLWILTRLQRPAGRAPRAQAPRSDPPRADTGLDKPTTNLPPHAGTIFISYRRADSADVTGRIYDRLIDRFGTEHVYKDVDSVPLGVDFREYVGNLVQRCDALIAIIGNQWINAQAGSARRLDDPRDLVRIEISAALARSIPVVPVLVGNAAMPNEHELPDEIRGLAYRNAISVRPDPDFHKDLDRLIAGIDAHFGRR